MEEDIELICTFPEEIQERFLSSYNGVCVELMNTNGFDINNLDLYIKNYGKFENEKLVRIINENMDIDKLYELYSNEYYIASNEELYLKYFDSYSNIRDLIEVINTKTYLEYYTNIEETDTSKNYLMLINKYHALSSDYAPNDLVYIDTEYGSREWMLTRAEVYEKYKQLQDDANALGYNFKICSGYRSYDYQYGLYNKYLSQDEGGQASVDTYSARPGHSEHQSGLCLDLTDAQYGMDNFGLSEASKWVNENCYKYGFIIRYTAEKEKITGYEAEPWQIRYVGDANIAKDIMDRNITFDEYYACFIEDK